MLKWLHVKNFALMEEEDVEFGPGFNAVTGETGAGKSVLMGALKILLGGRGDKEMIRHGETRCEISGSFSLDPDFTKTVDALLDAEGVAPCENGTLLLRRVFTPSSGRVFINSSPAGTKLLSEIGGILADIHGADETHGLLKLSEQMNALDRFAGNDSLIGECRTLWQNLSALRKEREELEKGIPSEQEAFLLRKDAEKIENADLHPGEDAEIESVHRAAANSREILAAAGETAALLTEADDSLMEKLSQVHRTLRTLERIDPEYASEFEKQCDDISEAVRALSDAVTDRAGQVELDENSFAALEERMRLIHELKRKFGPTIEEVLASGELFRKRLELFENAEEERSRLANEEKKAVQAHEKACQKLSASRKKASEQLKKRLSEQILKLGFRRAEFDVQFEDAQPGPGGSDKIEFLFSANPGIPVKPLRQVASSGELSRVMLALRTVLAESDRIPLLVFDEIDANIGGETAVTVAESLAALACHRQILSISHLPQVAARADLHFLVEKSTGKESAVSHVKMLDQEGRIQELARMLGGGAASESHARSFFAGGVRGSRGDSRH